MGSKWQIGFAPVHMSGAWFIFLFFYSYLPWFYRKYICENIVDMDFIQAVLNIAHFKYNIKDMHVPLMHNNCVHLYIKIKITKSLYIQIMLQYACNVLCLASTFAITFFRHEVFINRCQLGWLQKSITCFWGKPTSRLTCSTVTMDYQ